MITYKPSSRLGLLNEENFTSDPTSRGWVATGDTGSLTYSSSGAKVTTNNVRKIVNLTNTTTSMLKYISYTLNWTSANHNSGPLTYVKLYVNDVLISTKTLIYSNLATGEFSANAAVTVIINNPNNWIETYAIGQFNSLNAQATIESGVNTINAGINKGTKIRLELDIKSSSTVNVSVTLKNLKWV